MTNQPINDYAQASHALNYLARADHLPHRKEGETVLLELLEQFRLLHPLNQLEPGQPRVLDLGCGDGRLLALVKQARPEIEGVALDFSETMLKAVRERFTGEPSMTVVEHNMDNPLPNLGPFHAVVSSFAIHHLANTRKFNLYAEIYAQLAPGGIFCNLEHVSSPTPSLKTAFYKALEHTGSKEDSSNKCLSVEEQVDWLKQIGFTDVDCFWKWREFALLAGVKPS